jgi:hypothetical protein
MGGHDLVSAPVAVPPGLGLRPSLDIFLSEIYARLRR